MSKRQKAGSSELIIRIRDGENAPSLVPRDVLKLKPQTVCDKIVLFRKTGVSTIRQIREITGTILLVLNTAGALVFLLLGEEAFSLLLLTAALAVFLLRLRSGKTDSFGNRQTDRDASYIRYCPYCGYIGSQLPGESVPPCPACGRLLIATDTTLEEYTGLSVHRRSVLKKRWSSFVKDR